MPRIGPASFLGLNVVMSVVALLLSIGREEISDLIAYPLNAVALGLAGALVVGYQRSNPIGWVLSGMGFVAVFAEVTEGYGYHAAWPAAATLEWLANWTNQLGIVCTALVVLLFPTGRGLSRARRAGVWAGAIGLVLSAFGAAFSHASDQLFESAVNPHAIEGLEPVFVVGQGLFLVSLLGAIGSVILRFRRSTGVEHQQLKWVAYSLSLFAVVGPLAIIYFNDSALVRFAIALVVPTLPAAICIAILRYRLYDIDLIVSRTLAYGALTTLLAVAYLGMVWVLGAVAGGRSSWTTAGATAAVALAFRPLRGRLQGLVDRRFRRARYEALARVDTYLDDLRAGRAEPEALEALLRDVLEQPSIELRYLPPGATERAVNDDEFLVERAGVPVAIVAGGSGPLLREVVARAGLAIEIVRLRAEVTLRLAEVEASRARIVAAGYEERRRLERDLHDGAQQRLVSIGLALRNAQFALGDQAPVVRIIDAVVDELGVAIDELRELANGIRPAYLDDGLAVALRDLAERTPLPVEVHTTGERYPADVEATAYFVACEALANAVKHADAIGVTLSAEHADGELVMTIRDDGVGGARPADGTGLRGLHDRVAAQGGRMRVDSEPGAGTTVVAELPCAS
ncbi:histidine kinase [Cryptosporangium arvum]|uniref:histidine kinase n=1 Tax=Cryptosporangium arvum DSM 44712 TaxID=927661 RepID=A0A011AJ71_9ACTN|nr:histidine kinase [Cryptosporangium arvum]EXG82076.1 Histidine kinase,'ATPase, histidine kinase/DNA gyrase B/HSP90-like' [Cryptosporangium arvum DSM 44712]